MDVTGHGELHFHRCCGAGTRRHGIAIDAEVFQEEIRRFFLDVMEHRRHRLHLATQADVHGDLAVRVARLFLAGHGHLLHDIAGAVFAMRGGDIDDALHEPRGGGIRVVTGKEGVAVRLSLFERRETLLQLRPFGDRRRIPSLRVTQVVHLVSHGELGGDEPPMHQREVTDGDGYDEQENRGDPGFSGFHPHGRPPFHSSPRASWPRCLFSPERWSRNWRAYPPRRERRRPSWLTAPAPRQPWAASPQASARVPWPACRSAPCLRWDRP